MSAKQSISSLFNVVTAVADTATAISTIGSTYANGWSQRMSLAEETRLDEAKLEHKAAKILVPQRVAAETSAELVKIHSRVQDKEIFNQILEEINK